MKIYRVNKLRNKLELVDILRCPRESGPRIIRFSDDGKFAYILFELSNEIRAYKYDGSGKVPAFELIQTIETCSYRNDIMQRPVFLLQMMASIFSVQQQVRIQFPCLSVMRRLVC